MSDFDGGSFIQGVFMYNDSKLANLMKEAPKCETVFITTQVCSHKYLEQKDGKCFCEICGQEIPINILGNKLLSKV